MTNDDLKRLYRQNANPQNKDDFARYDSNGNITVADAVNPKDAVNYETLIKHAGGEKLYLHNLYLYKDQRDSTGQGMSLRATMQLITRESNIFTVATLKEYLNTTFATSFIYVPANGYLTWPGETNVVNNIYAWHQNSTQTFCWDTARIKFDPETNTLSRNRYDGNTEIVPASITDTVIEL